MADEKLPTEKQARERVEDAREQLESAQQLQAQVARGGTPHLVVEVLPGNTIHHEGETYSEGDKFAVEGLTAVGLLTAGHVAPKGLHEGDLPTEEQRREAGRKREIAQLEERLKELRK